jgi:multisubunit Na+/H+ antiporter MnhB subunit
MPTQAKEQLRAYYRIRQALGYLGFILPLLLVLGGLVMLGGVEPSISDYYHTVMRDVFVGVMCAIGLFLICYTGYEKAPEEWLSDDTITTISGVAAFGVAMFPNEGPDPGSVKTIIQQLFGHKGAVIGHYLSATGFFVGLAYICIARFTKTRDKWRARIYRVSGWTIVGLAVAAIVASVAKNNDWGWLTRFVINNDVVLWLEALAVWAFAAAWLTKGHAEQSLINWIHHKS